MPRLTDTQLVILSTAASRDDGAVLPLSSSIRANKGAITRSLKSLIDKGLIAEHPALRGTEPWREDDDGRAVTLMLTDAGRSAMGIIPDDGGVATETTPPAPEKPTVKSCGRQTPPEFLSERSSRVPKPGSKKALLIDLMARKQGATIDELMTATGWKAHSVRGAISGTVKKLLGRPVTTEKVTGRGRVFRIGSEG